MEVVRIENISKKYKLGVQGGKSFRDDLSSYFRKLRGNKSESQPTDSRVDSEGYFWALRDINFSINEGEVLGIIGKNGAGKSTLLKLLSRITAPSSGEIKIKGRMASLLEVGTGFHQELTGRENIFLNGAILGMSKREINSRLDEIIAFSGIEHHIDTPVKRYSSGMKVRLGFAVAAHLNPEILVIDEVLAVGDAEFQRKCIGKMQDIAGKGRTVLFVSHNMASVKSLCTRAVMLHDGKLVEEGAVDTIISSYIIGNNGDNLAQKIKTWNNGDQPEFKNGKLIGVKLEENSSNGFLSMNDSFQVKVQLELNNAKDNFGVNFHLINEESVVVFGSSSFEAGVSTSFEKGKHEFTARVPGNLLNTGFYNVKILVVDNGKVVCNLPDTIRFSIEEGQLDNRVRFEKRTGVVRPILDWKTNSI